MINFATFAPRNRRAAEERSERADLLEEAAVGGLRRVERREDFVVARRLPGELRAEPVAPFFSLCVYHQFAVLFE